MPTFLKTVRNFYPVKRNFSALFLGSTRFMGYQKYLAVEFIVIFIVLPTAIIIFRLLSYMLLFLWATSVVCWSIYRHYHYQQLEILWRWKSVTWRNMKPVLIRWAICALLITIFTVLYDPERLFFLLREKPEIIPFLMFLYPVFSVLPQKFVFCTFFFERYKTFFPTITGRVLASAIVFAYAHVLFINPVAPVLSFIGGFIFAGTFAKTKSLALVTIEHSLFGMALFVIGPGWYFWSGDLI